MIRPKLLIVLLFSFLVVLSCSVDKSPSNSSPIINGQDVLTREIKDGVFLSLEGFKAEYAKGETISGTLKLSNQNYQSGFPISINDYPPFGVFSIYNSDKERVFFYPNIHGQMVFDSVLNVDSTFSLPIEWDQSDIRLSKNEGAKKVENGEYKIIAFFRGNDQLRNKEVSKTIRISE